MCLDTDRFVDEKTSHFICSICHNVLCCPQTNNTQPTSKQEKNKNAHKYCEKCIKDWLIHNESCPDCREHLEIKDLETLDRNFFKILKELKIKCKNFKKGCEHVSALESIEQHEKHDCEFGVHECEKCGSVVRDAVEHDKNECLMTQLNNKVEQMNQKLIENENKMKRQEDENEHSIAKVNKRLDEYTNKIEQMNNRLNGNEHTMKQKHKQICLILFVAISILLSFNYQKIKEQQISINSLINENQELKKEIDEQKKSVNSLTNKNLEFQTFLVQEAPIVFKENNNKDVNASLLWATEKGLKHFVRLLIQNGANVNVKSNDVNDNWTPLIKASKNGNKDIVQILLENNANVNEKSNYGSTALMLASEFGRTDIVQLLIQNKANFNEKNNDGRTALYIAATKGYKEIVKLLIKNNANVDLKTNDGSNALMIASGGGYKEIVQLLIENKVKVNEKNKLGSTALMLASSSGHKNIVQLLIENGADVNAKNKDGHTALFFAQKQEIKDYLKSKGAV